MPVRLSIVVVPRSSRSEVAGVVDGAVKVRVTAPPAEGRANDECARVLARFFDAPKRSVRIVSGASARRKTVEIAGLEVAEVTRRLAKLW